LSKVSVIIPCYNHGRDIPEAVNSILDQTFQDFEIIIINDGSTNRYTNEILGNSIFPKTTIIDVLHGGVSKARNVGINNSNGEYILTLDADDSFESTYLEKAVSVLDNNDNVGIVTCGISYFGKEKGSAFPLGGGIENCLVISNACGNSLFRRRCWTIGGGYNENMKEGFEDWDLWLSITEKGWIVYTIPEVLFNYRRHSISRDTQANKQRLDLFTKIVANHKETYIKYLDVFVRENEKKYERLFNDLELIKRSKSYRLGETIIKPLRLIKNVLKNNYK